MVETKVSPFDRQNAIIEELEVEYSKGRTIKSGGIFVQIQKKLAAKGVLFT